MSRNAGSGSLARRLALAVLAVYLALGGLALGLGYAWMSVRFPETLRADTTALVRGAIDPWSYPTIQELEAAGAHLVAVSDIEGGAFVTGIGNERARFGSPPELGWAEARIENVRWRLAPDRSSFETFIGPETIGIAYGLLVRVDPAPRWQARIERLRALGLAVLAAGLLLAVATHGLARRLITRRLAAIDDAVVAALAEPDGGARRLSRVGGSDELAKLSRSVDRFLSFAAKMITQDLAAATALVAQSPHATLTFAPDGTDIGANRAALALFAVQEPAELAREGAMTLHFQGAPTTLPQLAARKDAFGAGEVFRADGAVPVLVAAGSVCDAAGEPLRGFATFVDMRAMVADMREQIEGRQQAEHALGRAQGELAMLRLQFEACLVILEGEEAHRAPPVAIDLAAHIEDWLDQAVRRDVMPPGGVVHEALPVLHGDPGALRLLIHLTLEAVRLRSGQQHPTIVVTATGADGSAELTVLAAGGDNSPCAAIADADGSALLIGAIAVLARGQAGELVAARLGETGNGLTMRLPVDVEAMQLKAAANTARPAA